MAIQAIMAATQMISMGTDIAKSVVPKKSAPPAPGANNKKPGTEGSEKPADFGGGQPPKGGGGGGAANAVMNAVAPIPIVGDLVNAGKNIHEMATGKGGG